MSEHTIFKLGDHKVSIKADGNSSIQFAIEDLAPYGKYLYIGRPVNGLAVARKKAKNSKTNGNNTQLLTGYLSEKTGKEVIPFDFKWGSSFTTDGYAAVIYKSKYYIIDSKGNFAIDDCFDDACPVLDKMRVRKNNRVGVLRDGQILWTHKI